MTATGPKLRTNPVYAYETSLVVINVTDLIRINGTLVSFVLQVEGTENYGVDIYKNGVYSHTVSNQTNVEVSLDKDYLIEIVPFFNDGTVTYLNSTEFQHYYIDQLDPDTVYVQSGDYINLLQTANTNPVNNAYPTLLGNYIHGSYLYNGYLYGSTRNDPAGSVFNSMSVVVRVPVNDFSNPEFLEINLGDSYPNKIIHSFEQIARIGKYLFIIGEFSSFVVNPPEFEGFCMLIMIDTDTFDYKLFGLKNINHAAEPILSDGGFLYIPAFYKCYKVDITPLLDITTKYNFSDYLPSILVGTYDSSLQGGFIDYPQSGYINTTKGLVHAGVVDDSYIYLAYTTGGNSGYSDTLGISVHEVHVIDKNTMLPIAWRYIPKCTDDMCQNSTHLFFGVEVQPTANQATYGYGWGTYALNKQDLIANSKDCTMLALPHLHKDDNTPTVASYASLLFGRCLLDFKTNRRCYILDISNVDNWSLDSNVGQHTLKVVK